MLFPLLRCVEGSVWLSHLMLVTLVGYTEATICTTPVCEFQLDVRWGRSMVYRTPNGRDAYNVELDGGRLRTVANGYRVGDPMVGRYVDPDQVHTGDGYPRTLIEINGQFPGPTLEVMEGAQVSIGPTLVHMLV